MGFGSVVSDILCPPTYEMMFNCSMQMDNGWLEKVYLKYGIFPQRKILWSEELKTPGCLKASGEGEWLINSAQPRPQE